MNQKMDETLFKELLKESITSQWKRFEYFRNICSKKKKDITDLLKAIDYEEYYYIPGVPATAFKKSKGLTRELSDFSQEGKFQVSSSTSGDPSFVYTNNSEYEKILESYRKTYIIEGVTKAVAFAPTGRIVDALSRKADYMGHRSAARMKIAIDAVKMQYPHIIFTLDVNLFRTILSKIVNGKPVLEKMKFDELTGMLSSAERNHEVISLGGFVLLFYPYIKQMKEGQFNLGKNVHVTLSGGGYSGAKGAFKSEKIDKSEMSRKLSSMLGLDRKQLATNFTDLYGSTESSALFKGYWNEDLDDFLFQSPHETRAFVVDPETEEPLKSGEGLLKFITPYSNGNPSAANVSVLQFDNATIRGITQNFIVTHFSHIRREQNASIEGCAYKAEEIASN